MGPYRYHEVSNVTRRVQAARDWLVNLHRLVALLISLQSTATTSIFQQFPLPPCSCHRRQPPPNVDGWVALFQPTTRS